MNDTPSPPTDTERVARLVSLLTVTPTAPDLFQGARMPGAKGRVFGGQVVGQALAAATCTVAADRVPHSLHAYFMRGGDDDYPIDYRVHRDYDGRSFTTRRVEALQGGAPILTLTASFQTLEEGFTHQDCALPDVPPPEQVQTDREFLAGIEDQLLPAARAFLRRRGAIDLRPVDPVNPMDPTPREPMQRVWFRTAAPLPDDAALHRTVLAYVSDMMLLGTSIRPHGVHWLAGNAKAASLDHALWLHEPAFRVDEWLLYVTQSPWAGHGRGLNHGQIFDPAGRLVASVSQEGLIRRARG